ncbi:MAG: hypothetical protein ACI90V_012229, partial [Bacillariaceae sp.]
CTFPFQKHDGAFAVIKNQMTWGRVNLTERGKYSE